MVTKKQTNTTSEIVLQCIETLKEAHNSPQFIGKSESGINPKIILIKFKNKIQYQFPMTKEEYSEYKKIEARLWK